MHILITGGVGFIGTNCTIALAKHPHTKITIVDNFSRANVHHNAGFIRKSFPNISIIESAIEKTSNYLAALKKADVVIHLAGQTAVTTSIKNPILDFTSNIVGGFHLLEALRVHNPNAIILYTSTNKVYGDLSTHTMTRDDEHKHYSDQQCPDGIDEHEPIDFISPYGCSKGTIDCYMQDYARMYGMNTVVFRQSCIYGPFQMGVEDQGWVAHFSKHILLNKPISIFGDGYQVRDLLHVHDLVALYEQTIDHIDEAKGQVFNIGGGRPNARSLLQTIDMLEHKIGNTAQISFAESRAGDQLYFVSDNTKAHKIIGWQPHISLDQGIDDLIAWQRQFYTTS